MSTEAQQAKAIHSPPVGRKRTRLLVVRDDKGGTASREGRKAGPMDPFTGPGKTQQAAEALLELATEETGATDLLVLLSDDRETMDKVGGLVRLRGHRLKDIEETQMERLIETAMPALSNRPSPAMLDQARRNAQARAHFLNDYETLEAEQVHELFGSKARNKAALAASWRADGKIFAVEYQGRLRYPAFQFDERGRPRPVIAKVLGALSPDLGPWQTAIWFTCSNGWLGGKSPVELLELDADAVVRAAAEVAEPVVF